MTTEPKTEKEVWRRYHIAEATARKKLSLNLFSLGAYLSAKNNAWDKKERQLAELRKKHKEATK